MNAARAKRRWIAWCRYVDKTQSQARIGRRNYSTAAHAGQVNAYTDAMYAGRAAPHGVRYVWYPKWGMVR